MPESDQRHRSPAPWQVERTADSLEKEYRAWARENMKVVVQAYFAFPGTRALWANVAPFVDPDVRGFVTDSLEEVPVLQVEAAALPTRDT